VEAIFSGTEKEKGGNCAVFCSLPFSLLRVALCVISRNRSCSKLAPTGAAESQLGVGGKWRLNNLDFCTEFSVGPTEANRILLFNGLFQHLQNRPKSQHLTNDLSCSFRITEMQCQNRRHFQIWRRETIAPSLLLRDTRSNSAKESSSISLLPLALW
jgi:hypothetical protein